MNTYRVTIEATETYDLILQAESEDEAEQKAEYSEMRVLGGSAVD